MNALSDLAAAIDHHQSGRLTIAERLYRQVLAETPDNGDALHMLGLIARTHGNRQDALEFMRRAAELMPEFPRVHFNLAETCFQNGLIEEAVDQYRISVQLDADLANGWYGLGRSLARMGQVEDAAACLRRAVQIDPNLIAARRDLVASGADDQVEPLKQALDRPDLSESDRIRAMFALGHSYDRKGDYAEAFGWYEEGNRHIRAGLLATGEAFNAMELREYAYRRRANCSAAYFKKNTEIGSTSDRPVFVVGMPRSGSTLIERIIASHPEAVGIDESNLIGEVVTRLNQNTRSSSYGDWEPKHFPEIAEGYLARLPADDGSARRVVDKTLDNLFHLPAIARLFPNAHIIICRRDPRDVCLSCFFQDFDLPMPYTNDLIDCAMRFRETDNLLNHFRSVLPLPVLDVQYESVVADTEAEARRIIAFLGLEWSPSCLQFDRSKGVVRTASLWQVRRPIFTDSIGRWRNYAPQIEPLLNIFGRD